MFANGWNWRIILRTLQFGFNQDILDTEKINRYTNSENEKCFA